MFRTIAGLVLAILVTACASSGTPGQTRGPRNVLTSEQIMAANATTAMEAVQQLRPEFLRTRGAVSAQNPTPVYAVVYVNGVRAGNLEILHSLRAADIEEIRYVSGADATTRYGTGHGGGVLEVKMRS